MLRKRDFRRRGLPLIVLLSGWTAMLVISAVSLFHLQQELTRQEALSAARAFASQAQGYLRWASVIGGLYANSEVIRPSVFLPSRKHVVSTSEGERLVFINPFQMIREENALRSQLPDPGASIRAVSLNPINPENAPDEWEKAGLLASDDLRERSVAQERAEGPVMRLLLPLTLEHTCLDCHRYQNEKVGGLLGGISVSVPLKGYVERGRSKTTGLFLAHLLAWFLGSGVLALYFHALGGRNREEMEEALRLRLLLGAANTLECLLDADGHPLYVSPSSRALIGVDAETLRRQPDMLRSFVHPEDRQRYQGLCAAPLSGSEGKGELVRLVLEDGSLRHHLVLCAAAADADGARKIRCTHVDFSGYKAQWDAAVRTDQEKLLFVFAGGVAHDFNNVLASIATFVHLLKEEFSDREDILREYITPLSIAFRLGKHFTANLLAFSQRQLVALKPTSLNRAVECAEEVVRAMISEEISFSCKLAAREMPVFADQAQVEQLVLDLVHNAKDAMPAGGNLAISTELTFLAEDFAGSPDKVPAGTYMRLSVQDTGCGIAADRFEDIFQPFYSTKKSKQGVGIGLVVVRGIVRRHNAFLDIASDVGRGTMANVYFAVTAEAREIPSPARGGSDESLPQGKKGVLLVDDDDLVRQGIARLLRHEGFAVFEAASGEAAVNVFREQMERIQLLVMDQELPGMSGGEACAAMRALQPGVQLLFLSGKPLDAGAGMPCPDSGVFFFEKPVNMESFVNKVREMIGHGC